VTRVWIDIEDMFAFTLHGGRRPTGIQRLAFELCKAIVARYGGDGSIRFLRHDRLRGTFVIIAWAEVETLFAGLTQPLDAPLPAPSRRVRLETRLRNTLRPLAGRLPNELRVPLVRMLAGQFAALTAFAALLCACVRLLGRRMWRRRDHAIADDSFAREAARGDVLLISGAAFIHTNYPALVARTQRAHGVWVALLLYDIIPVRRPEFVDRAHADSFRAWLDGMLPLCDHLFAISRSAADEAEDHARRDGLVLRDRVHPIPIGSGFSTADAAAASSHLPPPGGYVLFVSTIEARKNHGLLVRVWRRLLEALPHDQVPALVFAGRVGWMVEDLMQQLRNTNFLDGKIVLATHPTDAELAALYRGCLFTVFPSLYEGWGLPVTESLTFRKPCVISNATSLPEAGGALARYFDPENIAEATRIIRETITDRAGLAAWEQRVAREFRPVAWDETAQALMQGLLRGAAPGVAQTASV
jgi:glycosyltransferase involved in cell wall biosynthesis